MSPRSTRADAQNAEDQAVRLRARGLNDREIGMALHISESEARRKRLLGMQRRRDEAASVEPWSSLEAELTEALRVAYRDHDDAPKGSPARIGCLKVILDVSDRLARLGGLDADRAAPVTPGPSDATEGAPERNNGAELRDACRDAEERLRSDARAVLDLERAAGAEDVRPPEPEEPFSEGEQPS
jgi:hypothetical protein